MSNLPSPQCRIRWPPLIGEPLFLYLRGPSQDCLVAEMPHPLPMLPLAQCLMGDVMQMVQIVSFPAGCFGMVGQRGVWTFQVQQTLIMIILQPGPSCRSSQGTVSQSG